MKKDKLFSVVLSFIMITTLFFQFTVVNAGETKEVLKIVDSNGKEIVYKVSSTDNESEYIYDSDYKAIFNAISVAGDDTTITLLNNIDLEEEKIVISKDLTIDLSGKTLTSNNNLYTIFAKSKIKVTDSSQTVGTIMNTNQSCFVVSGESGSLLLDKGEIRADNYRSVVVQAGANMNMTGGKVIGKYGIRANGNEGSKSSVVVSGGEVIGTTQAIYIQGNIDATTNENIAYHVEVTINGSAKVSAIGANADTSVTIRGNGSVLNVAGGTIDATNSNGYAIAGNGTHTSSKNYGKTIINISGGEIKGGICGLYHPQSGTLNINGGNISGEVGLQLCSGKAVLEMSNGVIYSYGIDKRESKVGDGVVIDGAAVSVVNRKGYPDIPSIFISGGTFISDNQNSIISYKWVSDKTEEWDEVKNHLKIAGGNYSSSVSSYIINGYTQKQVEGKYVVYPKTTKIELPASTLNLEVGKTSSLKATLTPSATLDGVTYTSSNEKVATVDTNGKVAAIAAGTTTITAKAGEKTATCVVTVYKVETVTPPTVDTTKPVEEVTVGVNDKASQETISNTASSIVADIVSGKDVKGVDEATIKAVKDAVNDNKTITTEVKVEKIAADKVDEKAKDTIIKLVVEETKDGKTSTVVEYLDLSVLLKAEGKELGTINELDKEVSFTVAIPEKLVKDGRVFYVVRVHDGEAEKLPVTMNEDGTITFKTDRFSTYALVYEDAATTTPDPKPTPETPKDDKVDTSDNSVTGIYASVCGMALLAGGIVVLKKKKENLMNK